MGTIFQFHCPECGYDAEVSGGDDRGMRSVTTTIMCATCEELRDIEISKDPEIALLPDGSGFRPDFEVILRCKRCKGDNVSRWSSPGPCPKCGAIMDCIEPVIIWD
jgi:hypothetical protein